MADDPHSINNSGADGADYSKQKAPGPPGQINPPTAATGKAGVDNGKSCKTTGQKGHDGVHGNLGVHGQKGGTGRKGSQIKINLTDVSGDFSYITNGGKGGGGQPGGVGGVGQNGGAGGSASKHCLAGKVGIGGRGGTGGNGGDAGAGGDAGTIYITYVNGSPNFSGSAIGGTAGLAANPGGGGQPGTGSSNKGTGDPGSHGKSATGGKSGIIYINGKRQK